MKGLRFLGWLALGLLLGVVSLFGVALFFCGLCVPVSWIDVAAGLGIALWPFLIGMRLVLAADSKGAWDLKTKGILAGLVLFILVYALEPNTITNVLSPKMVVLASEMKSPPFKSLIRIILGR